MRAMRNKRIVGSGFEELEARQLLARDLAGSLGEHASLVADLNRDRLSPDVETETLAVQDGVVVGDRVYFVKRTTKAAAYSGEREFTTQIWSIDEAADDVRLEAVPHRFTEGNSDEAVVYLEQVDGVLFAAVSWRDFGFDESFSTLWSNASGQFLSYGLAGGIRSLNRFENEIYLDLAFSMIRTNPLTKEVNLVWREVRLSGLNAERTTYEDDLTSRSENRGRRPRTGPRRSFSNSQPSRILPVLPI